MYTHRDGGGPGSDRRLALHPATSQTGQGLIAGEHNPLEAVIISKSYRKDNHETHKNDP